MSPPKNDKPEHSPEAGGVALHTALKNKYRHEYAQTAKEKVSFLDMWFRSEAQRLKKIEDLAEKILERDIKNGVLQARAEAELTERQREAQTAEKTAREKPLIAPGNFDFMDWDPHREEKMPRQHAPQQAFNLQIPNVPVLQTISDEEFLKYVLNRLHSYHLGTAAYSAGMNGKYLLMLEKKFDISREIVTQIREDGSREEVENQTFIRNPDSKDVMYLNYAEAQTEYINAASQAVQSYNAYGKINLRTRENYILEEIEEIIRTAGYPPTQQYAIYCQQIRSHIAMQMKTFGDLREAWQQTKTPAAAKPIMNIAVSYNVQLQSAAGPAEKPKKKAKTPKATPPAPKPD